MFYKPPHSYTKGWTFKVFPHNPPPPTPITRWCRRNGASGRKECKLLHPIERALPHRPLEGPDPIAPFSVVLEIVDTLHVGEQVNAQVVLVEARSISPDSSSPVARGLKQKMNQRLVAKIYDPVYF